MATRNIHHGTVPARFLTCPPGCVGCTDCANSVFIWQRGVNIGRALHPFNPAATAAEVEQEAAASDEQWLRLYRHAIAEGIRVDARLAVTA